MAKDERHAVRGFVFTDLRPGRGDEEMAILCDQVTGRFMLADVIAEAPVTGQLRATGSADTELRTDSILRRDQTMDAGKFYVAGTELTAVNEAVFTLRPYRQEGELSPPEGELRVSLPADSYHTGDVLYVELHKAN